MDDIVLIESSTLRQKCCTERNTVVLEKVAPLDTFSGSDCATLKQVAEFYRVPLQAVRSTVFDHKAEFASDGYKIFKRKDLEKFLKIPIEIPNRGLALFPRRAILRVGMLLRDSYIAQKIRTYLLEVEEHSLIPQESNQLQKMGQQLIGQAQELATHANELGKHSEQLTRQANQLVAQARMISALAEEVYQNREHWKNLGSETQSLDKRVKILEQRSESTIMKNRKEEVISEEERSILKRKVQGKGNASQIWPKMKTHFGITRYLFLPKERFQEALKWLETF